MNIVFLIGKVISEIEFKFIIEEKDVAVVTFYIELENKSILKVKGYNEIADECYQQLKIGDTIAIQGILNNKGEIEIQDEIEIIQL